MSDDEGDIEVEKGDPRPDWIVDRAKASLKFPDRKWKEMQEDEDRDDRCPAAGRHAWSPCSAFRRVIVQDFINSPLQLMFITTAEKDKVRIYAHTAPKSKKKMIFFAKAHP